MKSIEQTLTGGHPNSLGNTVEVVKMILSDHSHFRELFECYFSDNEVVRLRVSNAMKRIFKENKNLLIPFLDRFLNEVSNIEQASTKWTLAQLFLWMHNDMNNDQFSKAKAIIKNYLETEKDWIVLNNSIETLSIWSLNDDDLKTWLKPHLEKLKKDSRVSVSKKALKCFNKIYV